MNVVALVPARGGSKGIPNKNLKKIGGLPLVARSVLAARGVSEIDKIYVSSDSDEILGVGAKYGAIPLVRPPVYASDGSSTEDVLLHFLQVMERQDTLPDILVYLQCTSPFTTSDDVRKVLAALLQIPGIDCAFSAIEDHAFLWEIDSAGVGVGVNHDAYSQRKRRQDLCKTYKENGAVYAVRVKALRETRNRFGNSARPIPITGTLPFEIDEPFELRMASRLASLFPPPGSIAGIGRCRAVIMDFDGVLSDDKVTVSEAGQESVVCSRADGLGIGLLRSAGVSMLILTREKNPVVLKRAEKVGVEIISGVYEKLPLLQNWARSNGFDCSEIAYVGNDINDLDCLNWVSFPVAPSDAHSEVLASGCLVLSARGGQGVIRELADIVILNRNS